MVRKLARGIANIATGFFEIPVQMMKETRETGDISGFFVGGAKGMLNAICRISTGLYETVSFPIPLPADYDVIFEPEFLIEGDLAAF